MPELAGVVEDAEPKVAEIVREPVPEVLEIADEVAPDVVEIADEAEPEVAEPKPAMHIVDTDEPEYVPATPLFETDPFVRHQRAAFGRKAR